MKNTKITSVFLSISVLTMLILAGPANALELNLNALLDGDGDLIFERPERITFNASISINGDENIPISDITLKLIGPEVIECTFDITGKPLDPSSDNCFGITIKKIAEPSINNTFGYGYANFYGYGYNFGYGDGLTNEELTYEINIQTQHFSQGNYTSSLELTAENKIFESIGPTVTITENIPRTSNNGGSNGRRGSSSSSSGTFGTCQTEWACTDWSACNEGIEQRSCEKVNSYCYANLEDKPSEERICEITLENSQNNPSNEQNNNNNENNNQQNIDSNSRSQRFLKGITGAVISEDNSPKPVNITLIILFLGGIAGFSEITRRKLKQEKWKKNLIHQNKQTYKSKITQSNNNYLHQSTTSQHHNL